MGAIIKFKIKLPEKISKIIKTLPCIVAMESINPELNKFKLASFVLLSVASEVETAVLETIEPKKEVIIIDFFLLKYLSKK